MDAVPIFRMLVTGTLIFAGLLLSLPLIQVAKSAQPWRGVIGLWISGWGFLLIGVGLHFADRGYGGVVLFGVATAGVGQLLQFRSNRRRGSGD